MNPTNLSPSNVEQTPIAYYSRMAARSNAGQRELQREDWVWLNDGCRVRVKRENNRVVTGMVDIVAPDASIFWVWLDHGQGRIALHEDDQVTVWIEESQDQSST